MERQWVCLSCGFESTRLQLLVRSDACVRCGYGMHAPREARERKKRMPQNLSGPRERELLAGSESTPLTN